MSRLRCPVTDFLLEKHPNADSLSIAHVGNWQCIVRTEEFLNDALGVYIPLGAIAPKEHPLLGFLEGKKVKTIKLRKVLSQGVLLPLSQVENYIKAKGVMVLGFSVGQDIFEWLDIKKWEPPTNAKLGSCDSIEEPFSFNRYTDIENYNNFPNVIPLGQEVWVTEKLHGTSARYALLDNKFYLGSRNRCLIESPKYLTAWHKISKEFDMESKLKALAEIWSKLFTDNPADPVDVIIYGEIVGKGVQNLHYGHTGDLGFYVYDIKVNGEYLPPLIAHTCVQKIGLKSVPILASNVPFTEDLLELRFGGSTLCGEHTREGIVIEPSTPEFDPEVGRVKLKVLSEVYLEAAGSEFEG